MQTLFEIDAALFRLINSTLANPVTDILMPILTDLNRHWWGWVIFGSVWIWLMTGFGPKGRSAGVLLLVAVTISDQLNSAVLKDLFARPRPCHPVDPAGPAGGSMVVEGVRLLVDCGGGFSFPSSHAANNFAAAFLVRGYFPERGALFLAIAAVIALSRTFVGVHYPGDLAGGAVVGAGVAAGVLLLRRPAARLFREELGPA